jgi:methylmalonyl-CoA mutase
MNEGVIKKKIQESADKEQELLIQERSVVGTNKYQPRRQMKHDLELFLCKNKTPKTLITPIIENDWQRK